MIKLKQKDTANLLPEIPDMSKLSTYLRYFKTGRGALPEMQIMGDKPTPASVKLYADFWKKEAQEERSGQPLELDDFFVVDYDEDLSNAEAAKFRLVVSTQRLLKLPLKPDGDLSPFAKVVANDDTGSFNIHDFPVMITGCNDSDRKFHPFAVSVCTGKSQADYKFIGSTIFAAQTKYSAVEPDPQVSLSDGADAIFNGTNAAVVNFRGQDDLGIAVVRRTMCYMHVDVKNVLKVISNICFK
jgi:hypothetical protein